MVGVPDSLGSEILTDSRYLGMVLKKKINGQMDSSSEKLFILIND